LAPSWLSFFDLFHCLKASRLKLKLRHSITVLTGVNQYSR
jgi:hypothetical protein